VWLAGPKGAGKTTLVEQFFARLNIPVASITCERDSKLSDFVKTKSLRATTSGAMEVVEIDGPIASAMRGGYPLVVNELDLADPGEITGLNDVIDRGIYVVPWSGEVIEAARGFIVFATANTNGSGDTTGEYAGTGTMNTALMSRFYKLTVGYPTPDEEIEVIKANGLLFDNLVGSKVVEIANAIRAAYTNGDGGLTTPISTREVLDIMECVEAFAGLAKKGISPLKLAFEIVYTNGLEEAAKKAVEEIIDRIVA
jgi:cobaltochelatase CobS